MPSSTECADELLETIPLLMRVIRTNVRTTAGAEFSVPQFRALAFLGRNQYAMLSDVAGFLGLTHPAASKLVDGLVDAKLVNREGHPTDRRRISLELTRAGHRRYESVLSVAREFLSTALDDLTEEDRAGVAAAMQTLHRIFASAPDAERALVTT
jgi:DNA-binding MarR family transcriptional regulator